MDEGRILAAGTVDEVREESTLEERFIQLVGGRTTSEGLSWLRTSSQLKWRYVLASLKRSVWAIIGIAFGALYLLGALTGLGFTYVGLGIDGSLDGPALALFLGFLVSLGWALIPIVWTGLDGTLDVSRFRRYSARG